jgi:hypothetical protein
VLCRAGRAALLGQGPNATWEEAADRFDAPLPDEVRSADREMLRRAFMTLAHRLQPAPIEHRCRRICTR